MAVVYNIYSTYLPSVVVAIPFRSAWTRKFAIISPSFRRKALPNISFTNDALYTQYARSEDFFGW